MLFDHLEEHRVLALAGVGGSGAVVCQQLHGFDVAVSACEYQRRSPGSDIGAHILKLPKCPDVAMGLGMELRPDVQHYDQFQYFPALGSNDCKVSTGDKRIARGKGAQAFLMSRARCPTTEEEELMRRRRGQLSLIHAEKSAKPGRRRKLKMRGQEP